MGPAASEEQPAHLSGNMGRKDLAQPTSSPSNQQLHFILTSLLMATGSTWLSSPPLQHTRKHAEIYL